MAYHDLLFLYVYLLHNLNGVIYDLLLKYVQCVDIFAKYKTSNVMLW